MKWDIKSGIFEMGGSGNKKEYDVSRVSSSDDDVVEFDDNGESF